MKKVIFAFITIFMLTGCKKLESITQFDMTYDVNLVIPSTTGINLPINIIKPNIKTNSESTFEVNDTRKDLIEEIVLKTLELKISSPSNADFSFVKSMQLFISAEGLNEEKVAWKDAIPENARTLTLDLSGVDLKEYIKADQFSLRLQTETDEFITSDHHIDVHSVFFVDAKILAR